jgi:D-alanyl-D-alanine carboxypeptidase/D-alanyl-D-alanine-endopeptidase (penicillin-binding protein 4)
MRTFALITICFIAGCSPARFINKSAHQQLIDEAALKTAHIGISIFEPAKNKYWYNYQGDKYFVPASNTKLPTCYAAMKYLGKYLPGLRIRTTADTLYIQPTGDPTFLHPDFNRHRVYDFLQNSDKQIVLSTAPWQDERWGDGWSWNDYNDSYMAERSAMPIYGNTVRISGTAAAPHIVPEFFADSVVADTMKGYIAAVHRPIATNTFQLQSGAKKETVIETPFYTANNIIYRLLQDTLHKVIARPLYAMDLKNAAVIHSQPTDSMLKIMMHRSDNFFAEQSLLMVSDQLLGVMNDAAIIDTLLKTDFSDLPQKPHWVDGSGLSRYNLFTPQDFVAILNKMKTGFGMERMKVILPTGGTGTIRSYYVADSNYIFAKTGSLSGVIAFSGYLYTKKGKLLIFSILVNNHQASGTEVRRAIEQFLKGIRAKG